VIVKDNRSELDGPECLGDAKTVVLLLRGTEGGSPARAVHDVFDANPNNWDPWHRAALITNQFPFHDGEKQGWFNGNDSDYYAVLRNVPGSVSKTRVVHGQITLALYTNGNPDPMKILDALQTT
jgi:hypothetical protein